MNINTKVVLCGMDRFNKRVFCKYANADANDKITQFSTLHTRQGDRTPLAKSGFYLNVSNTEREIVLQYTGNEVSIGLKVTRYEFLPAEHRDKVTFTSIDYSDYAVYGWRFGLRFLLFYNGEKLKF